MYISGDFRLSEQIFPETNRGVPLDVVSVVSAVALVSVVRIVDVVSV